MAAGNMKRQNENNQIRVGEQYMTTSRHTTIDETDLVGL